MTARRKPKVGGARAGAGRKPAGKERRFELRMPIDRHAAFVAAAEAESRALGDWLIAAGELALARGSTR